jgi:NAD(P)-dependent dehydrogenase (short-subunit alcohol dehydrogenase family)
MPISERKRIILTGVSRGLGLAMAQAFIEGGHTVWGCARSVASLAALRERYGDPHHFEQVDVADDAQVSRWAEAALNALGGGDLVINNAALINRNSPLWHVEAAEFSNVVDVNIKGSFHVIRHFAPSMVERASGVIVNFSSGWGRSVSAEVAPYCATKWAIEGLSQAMAEEVPEGMAVVSLNPGIIDTEMLRSTFGEGAGSYPDADDWAKRAVPFILKIGPKDNGRPLTVPSR